MRHRHLIAALAAALTATGCGAETDTDPASRATSEDAQLAFAKCMREKGIEIQDPGTGRSGRFRARIEKGARPNGLANAAETCRKQTGGGPPVPTAAQREEFREGALKFARCMRANGVDMPDPQGDGVIVKAGPAGDGVDPRNPAFQRAEKACRSHLPSPRGGGGAVEAP